MDLRVGQRPTVEPVPEPALLALQHPQRLHRHLFLAGLQQQQRSAEPMRVKTELPRHIPASRAIALSFTPPSLSCRALLRSQLSMDAPVPELQGGQQEQELRQLLNKDKSKRSKSGACPPCSLGAVQGPPWVWKGCVEGSPFSKLPSALPVNRSGGRSV